MIKVYKAKEDTDKIIGVINTNSYNTFDRGIFQHLPITKPVIVSGCKVDMGSHPEKQDFKILYYSTEVLVNTGHTVQKYIIKDLPMDYFKELGITSEDTVVTRLKMRINVVNPNFRVDGKFITPSHEFENVTSDNTLHDVELIFNLSDNLCKCTVVHMVEFELNSQLITNIGRQIPYDTGRGDTLSRYYKPVRLTDYSDRENRVVLIDSKVNIDTLIFKDIEDVNPQMVEMYESLSELLSDVTVSIINDIRAKGIETQDYLNSVNRDCDIKDIVNVIKYCPTFDKEYEELPADSFRISSFNNIYGGRKYADEISIKWFGLSKILDATVKNGVELVDVNGDGTIFGIRVPVNHLNDKVATEIDSNWYKCVIKPCLAACNLVANDIYIEGAPSVEILIKCEDSYIYFIPKGNILEVISYVNTNSISGDPTMIDKPIPKIRISMCANINPATIDGNDNDYLKRIQNTVSYSTDLINEMICVLPYYIL